MQDHVVLSDRLQRLIDIGGENTALSDNHAFRLAGRARGIHDMRGTFAGDGWPAPGLWRIACQRRADRMANGRVGDQVFSHIGQRVLIQNGSRGDIGEDERKAIGRMAWVQRHIGGTGAQDAENGGEGFRSTAGQQADIVALPDTTGDQVGGDRLGLGMQLAVT